MTIGRSPTYAIYFMASIAKQSIFSLIVVELAIFAEHLPMSYITALTPASISLISPVEVAPGLSNPSPESFDGVFARVLNHVNNTQLQAQQRMVSLEAGQDNVIDAVMAIQKTNQTMNMLIQVRNRLVEGYHEVFNQQI